MSTTAVTPAAPAAATEVTETPEVSLQERLNAATEEEYKTWERTGDIPPVKPKSDTTPPKTETSAASTEKAPSAAAPGESTPPVATETAAAPETARPQKKRNADARIQQLLEERKEEREKWEARLKEIEGRIPKPAEASASTKTDSQSAAGDGKTEAKATAAEPELGGINPKTGKPFQTIAEWQKEHTAWLREQMLSEVKGELTKTEQQRQHAENERKLNEELSIRLEPARKKYADFTQITGNEDLLIPRGSAADLYIRQSENPGEVLYYLGQHPDILASFLRETTAKDAKFRTFENVVHPQLQFLELAKLEARLMATPVPAAAAPVASKPSAPPRPLPAPPTVLAANTSAAGDAVEEALKKKSYADYEKAANASERKARRA